MIYRLGVDGGGTKTVAALAVASEASWREVGRGTAIGCNRDGTLDSQPLRLAIDRAFENAKLPVSRVSYACLALAGAGRDSVVQRVRQWADQQQLAEDVDVVPDVVPLLADAADDAVAVALIAGTGSLAWGRCPLDVSKRRRASIQGISAPGASLDPTHWRTARAGGLGPLLGDEGSGYWIGLTAVQRVARWYDVGGAATSLTEAVQSQFQVTDLSELPRCVAERTRDEIAAFAVHVLDRWAEGDAVATEIAQQATEQLAGFVLAVSRKLNAERIDQLSIAGGVLVKSERLRTHVLQHLQRNGWQPNVVAVVDDPVALTLLV